MTARVFVTHQLPGERIHELARFCDLNVWMGPGRVGLVAGARYATSFRSGEAPLFELREESLQRSYAEMLAGLRVVWE